MHAEMFMGEMHQCLQFILNASNVRYIDEQIEGWIHRHICNKASILES